MIDSIRAGPLVIRDTSVTSSTVRPPASALSFIPTTIPILLHPKMLISMDFGLRSWLATGSLCMHMIEMESYAGFG
ncbi:hypothetical protein FocTR4_00011804 [Fusarium oxysporum f. sp. cubense]|uniref:Uncharacterized protein n=1 Tax=Fusarium oxysporum f. sp. cubense TaxID=61366 RepID=A0A5C6SG20_FUSOC|nr:hypothetical protein FocTR4_00011804 [Fusarium oxysporum f. sp. cubense]